MKITDIALTLLKTGKNLLRVQTDAGVEGWAEAPGPNRIIPGREAVFSAYLDQVIKPALVGENPLAIDRHWNALALGRGEVFHRVPGWAVGIIDVALWDLMGKETGQPVFRLLGGAARTAIPLYWSTGSGWQMEPDEMLGQVKAGWDGVPRLQDPDGLARLAPRHRAGQGLRDVPARARLPRARDLPRIRCQQRLLRLDGHPARAALRGARHQSLRGADS
jgi:mannonate dehydratase